MDKPDRKFEDPRVTNVLDKLRRAERELRDIIHDNRSDAGFFILAHATLLETIENLAGKARAV